MEWTRYLIPIMSAILYRLDGKGADDPVFLPFKPFNNLKGLSLNYSRYAIGIFISLIVWNWIYLVTYALAVSVPYGEKSWTAKFFGKLRWLMVGVAFGGASLSWANALWCGLLFQFADLFDMDQAIREFFVMGGLGTIIYLWR